MAGVRKMNVSCDGNIVTVDGVKDRDTPFAITAYPIHVYY